jgi:hypothetical protein
MVVVLPSCPIPACPDTTLPSCGAAQAGLNAAGASQNTALSIAPITTLNNALHTENLTMTAPQNQHKGRNLTFVNA